MIARHAGRACSPLDAHDHRNIPAGSNGTASSDGVVTAACPQSAPTNHEKIADPNTKWK